MAAAYERVVSIAAVNRRRAGRAEAHLHTVIPRACKDQRRSVRIRRRERDEIIPAVAVNDRVGGGDADRVIPIAGGDVRMSGDTHPDGVVAIAGDECGVFAG